MMMKLFLGLVAIVVAASAIDFAPPTSNLYLWGSNSNNLLGFSDSDSCSVPLPLPIFHSSSLRGQNLKQVVVGTNHAVALLEDGRVLSLDSSDSVGEEFTTFSVVSALNGQKVVQIAAGDLFTLILTDAGKVYGYGDNSFGQLCSADNSFVTVPVLLNVEATISSIAAGSFHSLLVDSNGAVFGCGRNDNNQLGLGDASSPVTTPTKISVSSVKQVSASETFSLFLDQSGRVFGAGARENGELGSQSVNDLKTPTMIQGLTSIKAVKAAKGHSLFLKADGSLWTAGDNTEGTLGTGNVGGASSLVAVKMINKVPIKTLVRSVGSKVAGFVSAIPSLKVDELLSTPPVVNQESNLRFAFDTEFIGSIPLSLAVQGPATLSRSSIDVAGNGFVAGGNVFVSCTGPGPVSFSINSPFFSAPVLATTSCTGDVTITIIDPVSNLEVPAVIPLGGTLRVFITLSPAAPAPLRLHAFSNQPQVITVSQEKISYSTGLSQREITLISPVDGQIGLATITIAPESFNTYEIVSFTVRVVGSMSASVSSNCQASNLQNEVVLSLSPAAPGVTTVSVSAGNGVGLSSSVLVIPNGQNQATFTVSGGNIGTTTLSFRTDLYGDLDFNFVNFGGVNTNQPANVLQGAVNKVTLTLVPTNGASYSLNLVATNAQTNPASPIVFTAGRNTQVIEVIGTNAGEASITYFGTNLCNRTDVFQVGSSVVCTVGYTADSTAQRCAACPGNPVDSTTGLVLSVTNSCNNRGLCSFSNCFTNKARCTCQNSFFGPSCEFDTSSPLPVVQGALSSTALVLSVPEVTTTSTPAIFNFPANVVNRNQQPANVFIAPYLREFPFAGAVDPKLNTPAESFSTDAGFIIEVTCSDNTPISDSFLLPVTVTTSFDQTEISQKELVNLELFYWTGKVWTSSQLLCPSASRGYNFDLSTNIVTTQVCKPGIYNYFIASEVQPAPNTGINDPDQIDPSELSGGRPFEPAGALTGFQLDPPTVQPTTLPAPNTAASLSFSVLALAVSMVFFFLF